MLLSVWGPPRTEMEPMFPALTVRFLTAGPPGKSPNGDFLILSSLLHLLSEVLYRRPVYHQLRLFWVTLKYILYERLPRNLTLLKFLIRDNEYESG